MTKTAELVKTKTVTDKSLPGVSVTVGMATYKMGLTRKILMDQARQAQRAAQEASGIKPDLTNAQELAEAVGPAMIYPSLIAATVEQTGFESWPPTADEVMDLPESFVATWEIAAYDLNPHWRVRAPDEEDSASKKG